MSSVYHANLSASLDLLCYLVEASWPDTLSGETHTIDSALDVIISTWQDVQADMTSAMAALKAERNATIGAGRLPVELLQDIFLHSRGDWKTALAISHTCSRWREVIVHDAEMWTHIDVNATPQPVVSLFAERSKGRNLSVRLLMSLLTQAQLPGYWRDLFCYCEASRIKQLQLVVPRTLRAMSLSPTALNTAWITGTSMPLLEELSVTADYPMALRTEDFVFETLLSGHAPKLRSLILDGVWFPWGWEGYKGLTKLHIVLKGLQPLRHDQDRSILNVFRDSPGLEDIFISIPYATQVFYPVHNRTSLLALPRAKKVHLDLVPAEMDYILSSVSLPDDLPFLKLRCRCFTPGTISQCLPSNSECLPDLDSLTAITLDYHTNEIRLMPGPDQPPREEPRMVVIEVTDRLPHPPAEAFLSVTDRLRDLRSEPFYALYVSNMHSRNTQESNLIDVLESVPPAHILGLGGCEANIVDVLEVGMADLELGQLEFYNMELDTNSFLRLATSRHSRIRMLAVLQCTLISSSEMDTSRTLESVNEILQGRTWYKDVTYGTDSRMYPRWI